FCALPLVTLTGGHVIVELITWRVPPRVAMLAHRLLYGGLAAIHATLAFGVWRLAARSVKRNELSEYLQLPVGYVQYFAVGCLSLTALVCLWRCLGPHTPDDANAT
ncbi:MAG: TRAP transporter small permease subunit, partial [Pseudomonadota bacterium]